MGQDAIDLATLLAIVATVLSVSCTWPQLARIRRTSDVAGVSIAAAALTVSSEVGWTLYLAGEGLWSAVPEGALNIAANALLVGFVARCGGSPRRAIWAAVWWVAVLVGACWLGGLEALAALLGIAYVVQLTPAVATAWRTWNPTGIATTTWTLRLGESAMWGVYGQVRGDPPLLVLGILGVAESTAILLRKALTRNRSPRQPVRRLPVTPSQLLDDAMVR